jgi:hypothetical protein
MWWCTVMEEGNLGFVCSVMLNVQYILCMVQAALAEASTHLPLDAASCLLAPCTPTFDAGHALLP